MIHYLKNKNHSYDTDFFNF
uniref:Uncharacterized protein n=1 Tax=Arundo donax TaxID=35708 RepID=A0A0A8ZYV2_ARUDO